MDWKKYSARIFLRFIPFAVLITLFCGLVYGSVQHVLRIGANDPQIQMAEDTANFASQKTPQSILLQQQIDISKSLAPFLIVFNETGQIISSSANLHGQPPVLPNGIFDNVRKSGEERFTWQPEPGVRSAVVVTHFDGASSGFVLAGRSLREVERREDDLMLEVTIAWIVSLATLFIVIAAAAILFGKERKSFLGIHFG